MTNETKNVLPETKVAMAVSRDENGILNCSIPDRRRLGRRKSNVMHVILRTALSFNLCHINLSNGHCQTRIFAYAMISGGSAASGVTNLNRTGIRHSSLPNFCKPLRIFCNRVAVSIAFTFFSCFLLALLAVLDADHSHTSITTTTQPRAPQPREHHHHHNLTTTSSNIFQQHLQHHRAHPASPITTPLKTRGRRIEEETTNVASLRDVQIALLKNNWICGSRFYWVTLIILAIPNVAPDTAAEELQVGGTAGWRLPGFEYRNDSVVMVDKWWYYHCNASHPVSVYNTGNTIINLDKPGPMYFVRGDPMHRKNGQRLFVEVQDSSATSPFSSAASSSNLVFLYMVLTAASSFV
ncbi:unnamed protein product [Fraxinus pennsylvanica]|uniref:CASP-like protein n=1 Tax=Fraxinus pennsylvanica TaxID=56036 RepID=A0AAD2DGP3_9LAMI|nr:unnamed protein product [Fraxinus pennsylvanica]